MNAENDELCLIGCSNGIMQPSRKRNHCFRCGTERCCLFFELQSVSDGQRRRPNLLIKLKLGEKIQSSLQKHFSIKLKYKFKVFYNLSALVAAGQNLTEYLTIKEEHITA